ncbi:MAG: hypothetical protein GWP08_17595 [Nitrospiraceae bacterium]|nr:hypothetical protein [Nitrospiraceae bacterium]
MSAFQELLSSRSLWALFGVAGSVVFYGRFFVQWYVSERRKESVIPIAFWYMSSVGSLMIFVYAVYLRSPGAAFGQCFNIVVYSRNLIHIWRERGTLSRARNITVHTAAALIALVATIFMAHTWYREYTVNQSLDPAQATENWFWLGVWGVGQLGFFLRFFIQWLATEIKKKSVVPPVFWYLSLMAATLQASSFFKRGEWILAVGMCMTILIYARNLHLLRSPNKGASS